MKYLDRYKLRNRLMDFTPKIISMFVRFKNHESLSADKIDEMSFRIGMAALNFASEERGKRKYNIPDDIDLVTEQYDNNGLRRYSMRNMDDEAVMVPDEDGFWTPVNDVVRMFLNDRQTKNRVNNANSMAKYNR